MTPNLYSHQKHTIQFGRNMSFADLSEMGTGKTISTLGIISQRKKEEGQIKVLVICPKSIVQSAWVSDCEMMFPDLKIIPAIGSKNEKVSAFMEDGNIYVTNYETMNQGFDFSHSKLDILVCDEAVRLKNPHAKWTKAITKLGQHIPYRIILSGLITPNNLQEIYAPFNFIEPGIFGKSFYSFRSQYFTPDPWSYQNREWIPKKDSEKKITDKLKHLIIRHTKDECLDLPDKIHTIRNTEMTKLQKQYYSEMKKTAILKLKDEMVPAVTKAVLIQKLAQISSGFVYDQNKKVHRFESSKIRELDSILFGELQGEQVLVFINFQAESKLFRDKYPGESFIYGGQNSHNQTENINAFKGGKNRLMFASVSAAKYGLTFTNCSHVIYYSLNYSLDDFAQSQDRIHRIGQKRNAHYIYLLNKGTVDKHIYNAVMNKKRLNDLIIELIEE